MTYSPYIIACPTRLQWATGITYLMASVDADQMAMTTMVIMAMAATMTP